MVEGLGIDIIEIDRMDRTVREWGDTFLNKVFTERELAYATSKMRPIPHLAARFAAKEAVAKALTIGWRGGFRWKDVEVTNDETGKPSVVLYGKLKDMLRESNVLVSISHSETIVVAIALIDTKE